MSKMRTQFQICSQPGALNFQAVPLSSLSLVFLILSDPRLPYPAPVSLSPWGLAQAKEWVFTRHISTSWVVQKSRDYKRRGRVGSRTCLAPPLWIPHSPPRGADPGVCKPMSPGSQRSASALGAEGFSGNLSKLCLCRRGCTRMCQTTILSDSFKIVLYMCF